HLQGAGRGPAAGFRAVVLIAPPGRRPCPAAADAIRGSSHSGCAGLTTWLIPLWAAVEGFTTHNRPQDRRYNSPQDSARPAIRGARRRRGPRRTVPSAFGRRPPASAVPRNPRMGLTCGGGEWREWRGLRRVGQDWFCPVPVAVADRLCGGTGMVTEQPVASF